MRRPSTLQSRIVKKPAQYGITWLLATTFVFAAFFAAGGPLVFGAAVFVTGVLAVALDGLAFVLHRKGREDIDHLAHRSTRAATIKRRYWYGLATRRPSRLLPHPVLVMILVHIGITYYLELWLTMSPPHAYYLPRMMQHAVNGAFTLYVLVALGGTVLPHLPSSRIERLPWIVALVLLSLTQFAIFCA